MKQQARFDVQRLGRQWKVPGKEKYKTEDKLEATRNTGNTKGPGNRHSRTGDVWTETGLKTCL